MHELFKFFFLLAIIEVATYARRFNRCVRECGKLHSHFLELISHRQFKMCGLSG